MFYDNVPLSVPPCRVCIFDSSKRVENKPPTSRKCVCESSSYLIDAFLPLCLLLLLEISVQTVRKYTLGTPAIPKKNSAPAAPPAPCEPPMYVLSGQSRTDVALYWYI